MSSNLQYVGDNNQKLCSPIVPVELWFFINSCLQCRCIQVFLVAILTDWSQMIKKAFATQKLSFLSITRLEFQNVFQACMHIRENLDNSPFFLVLPVSSFLAFYLPVFISGRFPAKYQGK